MIGTRPSNTPTAPNYIAKVYRRIIYVHIADLERIALFDAEKTTSTYDIKCELVSYLASLFQLHNDQIHEYDFNTFYFNCYSKLDDKQIRHLINRHQFKSNASIELKLLIGMAKFEFSKDKPTAHRNAIYQLHLNKAKEITITEADSEISFDAAVKNYSIELAMPTAFQNNEFFVVYQPIVSSKSLGAEALIRWKHNNEFISPLDFIHISERSSIIYTLTKFVIDETLSTLKIHPELEFISVNLSPKTLNDIEWLLSYLESLSLTNNIALINKIAWEITEVTKLTEKHWDSIELLRTRGHAIFIDDFGAGHTSFHYLLKGIDTVKIDQAITKNVSSHTISKAYFSSIIQLCNNLELDIVLEGVETADEYYELIKYNSRLQGYHISMPLKQNELTNFIIQYQEEKS